MDRIFAVLFTLYVVSSVIVAIVRKLRTEIRSSFAAGRSARSLSLGVGLEGRAGSRSGA